MGGSSEKFDREEGDSCSQHEERGRKAPEWKDLDYEEVEGTWAECLRLQGLFYNIGEDKLDKDQARLLAAHEAACPVCRADFATWREIRSALQHGETGVPVPPDFAAGVMARIAAFQENQNPPSKQKVANLWLRNWLGSWKKGLAAAAVILALLTGSVSSAGKLWHHKPNDQIAQNQGGSTRVNPPEIHPGPPEIHPGPDKNKSHDLTANPDVQKPPVTKTEDSSKPGLANDTADDAKEIREAQQSQPQVGSTKKRGETQLFLDKKRAITTTMLRVAVAGLEESRNKSLEIARSAGAKVSSEVTARNEGRENVIIRFTLTPDRAAEFLSRLVSLGQVLMRDTTTQDITEKFGRTLEEYQNLQAQQAAAPEHERPRLEAQLNFLEQQLQSWDEEAERHVVILWLEE